MRVPSARSPGVGLAKVPQRAYLDLAGATAWDISPVGSRGNLDLMQYALISFDVQLILAQMGRARGGGAWPQPGEQAAPPPQGAQHQLREKEGGAQGNIPSYRWSKAGMFPGFAGSRMRRKIEVQDPTLRRPVLMARWRVERATPATRAASVMVSVAMGG